jgi:hypothetical protein
MLVSTPKALTRQSGVRRRGLRAEDSTHWCWRLREPRSSAGRDTSTCWHVLTPTDDRNEVGAHSKKKGTELPSELSLSCSRAHFGRAQGNLPELTNLSEMAKHDEPGNGGAGVYLLPSATSIATPTRLSIAHSFFWITDLRVYRRGNTRTRARACGGAPEMEPVSQSPALLVLIVSR